MQFHRAIAAVMRDNADAIDRRAEVFISEVIAQRCDRWEEMIMAEMEKAKYARFYGQVTGREQMEIYRAFHRNGLRDRLLSAFRWKSNSSIITDGAFLQDLFASVYHDTAGLYTSTLEAYMDAGEIRYSVSEKEIDAAFTGLIAGVPTAVYFANLIAQRADRILTALIQVIVRALNAEQVAGETKRQLGVHLESLKRDIRIAIVGKFTQAQNACIESLNLVVGLKGLRVQYGSLSNG